MNKEKNTLLIVCGAAIVLEIALFARFALRLGAGRFGQLANGGQHSGACC